MAAHQNTARMRSGAARLYGMAVRARAAGFRLGLLPSEEAEGIAVVSVGNLRAGGSGKTPMAIWLCEKLAEQGRRPALVSRGYRGRLEARGGIVSLGQGPLLDPEEAGDEAFLAAVRLPGVPVMVGRDRAAGVRCARELGAEVAVLDDGFQHLRLQRDLDLLLVCPEDLDPCTRLLPAGPLREGPGAASRADLLGGFADDWQGRPDSPPILFEHRPTGLVSSDRGRGPAPVPLEPYRGAPVYLLSGIARPKRFRKTAADAGLKAAGEAIYGDHHRFSRAEIQAACADARRSGAEAIVTTEKNLYSIAGNSPDLPVLALGIAVRFTAGEALLESRLGQTQPRLDPLGAGG